MPDDLTPPPASHAESTVLPSWRPETLAIALGRPHGPGSPLNTPPHLASTYLDGGETLYGRFGNPSFSAFEEALGALEGGKCVVFGSGMAAVAGILEQLPVGARVLHGRDVYQGVRSLLADVGPRGRLVAESVDPRDLDAVRAALPGAAMLWIESPSNPQMEIADIAALAALATEAGVKLVVDNTFATPLGQNPLALGAWAVLHSVTKFIGGHSDLLMGAVVTADDQAHADLLTRRALHGAIPGPLDVFLALRGLRSLAVRYRAATESAAVIAQRLADDPRVTRVFYPGLPEDPGHQVAAAQMRSFGAMLSFCVADEDTADRLLSRTKLIAMATSLGGVESLAERRNRWPAEKAPTGLIRLSVGLERVEDLWADLDVALS